MSDGIEDRWFRTTADGERVKTDRHGRGQRWRCRYRDPDGRQRTKSFHKKADAERFARRVKSDMDRGEFVDPQAGRTTLAAFAQGWLARQTTSEHTRRQTASRLNARILPTLGHVELRSLRPSTVQQFVAGLERDGLAAGTVRLYMTTLSQVLNAAVDDGLIPRNPARARSVKAPAAPEPRVDAWTPEQVATVTDALPARYRAVAVVAAGCGLRRGEALGLRVGDVDWLRGQVHVRQQLRPDGTTGAPKRGKRRDVPLPEHVALELSAHVERHGSGADGLLFTEADGSTVRRKHFDAAWGAGLDAAGLARSRENGPHALRHFYASTLLAAGVSVRAVADWLGHADGGALLLKVYAHVMPSDADRGRAVVDAALGAAGDAGEAAR